jgi:hypothetical protein
VDPLSLNSDQHPLLGLLVVSGTIEEAAKKMPGAAVAVALWVDWVASAVCS